MFFILLSSNCITNTQIHKWMRYWRLLHILVLLAWYQRMSEIPNLEKHERNHEMTKILSHWLKSYETCLRLMIGRPMPSPPWVNWSLFVAPSNHGGKTQWRELLWMGSIHSTRAERQQQTQLLHWHNTQTSLHWFCLSAQIDIEIFHGDSFASKLDATHYRQDVPIVTDSKGRLRCRSRDILWFWGLLSNFQTQDPL